MKFTPANRGITYPFFGVFDDGEDVFTVIFISHGNGIVVESNTEDAPIGCHNFDWDMTDFTKTHGTLEL